MNPPFIKSSVVGSRIEIGPSPPAAPAVPTALTASSTPMAINNTYLRIVPSHLVPGDHTVAVPDAGAICAKIRA